MSLLRGNYLRNNRSNLRLACLLTLGTRILDHQSALSGTSLQRHRNGHTKSKLVGSGPEKSHSVGSIPGKTGDLLTLLLTLLNHAVHVGTVHGDLVSLCIL